MQNSVFAMFLVKDSADCGSCTKPSALAALPHSFARGKCLICLTLATALCCNSVNKIVITRKLRYSLIKHYATLTLLPFWIPPMLLASQGFNPSACTLSILIMCFLLISNVVKARALRCVSRTLPVNLDPVWVQVLDGRSNSEILFGLLRKWLLKSCLEYCSYVVVIEYRTV